MVEKGKDRLSFLIKVNSWRVHSRGLNPDSNSGFKRDSLPAADGEVPRFRYHLSLPIPARGFPTWTISRALPAPTPPGVAPPYAGPQLGPEPLWVVDDKLPAAPRARLPGCHLPSERAPRGTPVPGQGALATPRRRPTLAVEPQRCWAGGRQGASRDCAAALRTRRLRAGAQRGRC